VDGQAEAHVLGVVTRKSASKKRVPDVTRHAPWLPKASPYEHRKQPRRAVRFAAEHTFEAVFDQWVEFGFSSAAQIIQESA